MKIINAKLGIKIGQVQIKIWNVMDYTYSMFKSKSAPKDVSSNSMFMLQVHLKALTNILLNNTCFPSELQMACKILTQNMIQFH